MNWDLEPVDLNDLDTASRSEALQRFNDHIWEYYRKEGRSFPWRETSDPYRILLSELMLQQTQTSRVLPKYHQFLQNWPDFEAMASSSLPEVLSAWRGLGYNRRALALRTIAQRTQQYGWTLPNEYGQLLEFPMIGPATAGAIIAFAYGERAVYLETNVRRVLIHQFHPNGQEIKDRMLHRELSELAELQDDCKHWYYALMDYGVYLKTKLVNPNRKSAHYRKQAPFSDSNRQIRGMILVAFTERGNSSLTELYKRLPFPPERVLECLQALEREGFVKQLELIGEEAPCYGIVSDT